MIKEQDRLEAKKYITNLLTHKEVYGVFDKGERALKICLSALHEIAKYEKAWATIELIGTCELNGISKFNYKQRVTNIQKLLDIAKRVLEEKM